MAKRQRIVVLDTNVLRAGLRALRGLPPAADVDDYHLLARWRKRPSLFDIAYNEPILDEYKENLQEVLPQKRYAVGRLVNLIRELWLDTGRVPGMEVATDPDDDIFIAVAVALVAADAYHEVYLVTNNISDYKPFMVLRQPWPRVVTPGELRALLRL